MSFVFRLLGMLISILPIFLMYIKLDIKLCISFCATPHPSPFSKNPCTNKCLSKVRFPGICLTETKLGLYSTTQRNHLKVSLWWWSCKGPQATSLEVAVKIFPFSFAPNKWHQVPFPLHIFVLSSFNPCYTTNSNCSLFILQSN